VYDQPDEASGTTPHEPGAIDAALETTQIAAHHAAAQ
jgi:hypothetical protein